MNATLTAETADRHDGMFECRTSEFRRRPELLPALAHDRRDSGPRGTNRTNPRRELLAKWSAPRVRPPMKEDIRLRAYALFVERHGGPGDALSDWLEAEAELWSRYLAALTAEEDAPRPGRRRGPRPAGPSAKPDGDPRPRPIRTTTAARRRKTTEWSPV